MDGIEIHQLEEIVDGWFKYVSKIFGDACEKVSEIISNNAHNIPILCLYIFDVMKITCLNLCHDDDSNDVNDINYSYEYLIKYPVNTIYMLSFSQLTFT